MSKKPHRYLLNLAVVLLVISNTTCFDTKRKGNSKKLISDEKKQSLTDWVLVEAGRNTKKKCPRPVFRGEPIEGRAAPKIIEVIEGTPDTHECMDTLAREKELDQFLPYKKSQDMEELVQICNPAILLLMEAVRYTDGCSPYMPGVRKGVNLFPFMNLAKIIIWKARDLWAGGNRKEAVKLLLDALHFGQDLTRGGVNIITAMFVVTINVSHYAPALNYMLNQPGVIGAELLQQAEDELSSLIETEPHPILHLKADKLSTSIYTVLPEMMGPNWTPPGHVAADEKERKDSPYKEMKGHTLALVLAVTRKSAESYESVCPLDKSMIECGEGLIELKKRCEEKRKEYTGFFNLFFKMIFTDEPEAEIEKMVMFTMQNVSGNDRYVRKIGESLFHIAALRVHARFRRMTEESGTCPGIDAFGREPLKSMMKDPYSGRQIQVKQKKQGEFLLTPPDGIYSDKKPPEMTIKCQKPDSQTLFSIRQKNSTISITKTADGPRYTVTRHDGGVIMENAAKEEFKARFPQEYNDVFDPLGSIDL